MRAVSSGSVRCWRSKGRGCGAGRRIQRSRRWRSEAPAISELRRELETRGHARGRKSGRLVDGRAREQVVSVSAEARCYAALDANHRAGQLCADERDRLRTPYAAVIQARVNCLTRLPDRHLQFIAPVKAARCGQHRIRYGRIYCLRKTEWLTRSISMRA